MLASLMRVILRGLMVKLLGLSLAWLLLVPQTSFAHTMCPNSNVHGTTSLASKFAYQLVKRHTGTCTNQIAISSNGSRVFSSRADCRNGRFNLVGERSGGILPSPLTCTNCTVVGQRDVIIAPDSSAQISAYSTFFDGKVLRYTSTISRGPADANGRTSCSISNASIAGASFGGGGSAASNTAIVGNKTVIETQKKIAQFMATRPNQLVANQPDLTCFLAGACSGGGFDLIVTKGPMNFNLTSQSGNPVWFRLKGSFNKSGTVHNDDLFGAIGAHRHLNQNTLLGLTLELGHQSRIDGVAKIDGTDWLVGPYIVGRLPNQPLFYEARALWGKTNNTISPFGTDSDTFETERFLIQAKVLGKLKYGATTLTPSLSGAFTKDTQIADTDSLEMSFRSKGSNWARWCWVWISTRPLIWVATTGIWVTEFQRSTQAPKAVVPRHHLSRRMTVAARVYTSARHTRFRPKAKLFWVHFITAAGQKTMNPKASNLA
jgi:hypothetical protein